MVNVTMVGLDVILETDEGKQTLTLDKDSTKYWDAIKKLLEDEFTKCGTRVPPAVVPIGEPKKDSTAN